MQNQLLSNHDVPAYLRQQFQNGFLSQKEFEQKAKKGLRWIGQIPKCNECGKEYWGDKFIATKNGHQPLCEQCSQEITDEHIEADIRP